jgi:hypothetical protein
MLVAPIQKAAGRGREGGHTKYKALADALSIDKGYLSLSLATRRRARVATIQSCISSILCQRERDQARAQHRQACCSQGEKAARDDVLMSHKPPPALDARPNWLRFSEKPDCKKVMLPVVSGLILKSSPGPDVGRHTASSYSSA